MKYKVLIQEEALDELEDIYVYIAQNHPRQSAKFVGELKKNIRELKFFPRKGTLRPEFGNDSIERRFITYKGYSIIYRVTNSEVQITHIISPGLNWRNFP